MEIIKEFSYYNLILIEMLKKVKYKDMFPEFTKGWGVRKVNESGSRISSKTMSALIFAVIAFMMPSIRVKIYVFVSEVKKIRGDGIYDEIAGIFDNFGFIPHMDLTRATFSNGRGLRSDKIVCKGLNDKGKKVKLSGLAGNTGYDYVVDIWDETYEFKQEDYDYVTQAIRGCENRLTLKTANPWVLSNWYVSYCNSRLPFSDYEMMTNNRQFGVYQDEWFHYTNWRVNPHVKDVEKRYMEQLEIDNPVMARPASYGLPGMEKGSIYAHLMTKISSLTQPSAQYIGGIDFGFRQDATSLILCGYDGTYSFLNIVGEYFHNNAYGLFKSHETMLSDMLNKLQVLSVKNPNMLYGVNIYCDHASWALIEWINKIALQRNIHWVHFLPCKKIEVEYRVGFQIQMISNNRVNIDLECVNFRRELELARWDETKAKLVPVDADNHTQDAFHYAFTPIMTRFKVNLNPFGARK